MIKILIGLLVLSVMVFIHEAGHFVVAKLCGVVVESFSIGWGPVILKKKIGETEYRLSLIPIGGYCGMKGENAFRTAIEENLKHIPKEEGGLYNASPFRRILIAFAGPFANYASAVLCFAIISGMGSISYAPPNTIAPVHFYEKDAKTPAKDAGLQLGDKVTEIDGKKIETFADIMQTVAVSADVPLTLKIEREGKIIEVKITPNMNKNTGAGIIGVYPFIPLKIAHISQGGVAETAKLQVGDLITKIDGKDVSNTIELQKALKEVFDTDMSELDMSFIRNGKVEEARLHIVRIGDTSIDLGLSFASVKKVVEGKGVLGSLKAGFVQTHEMMKLTVRSFSILFKGVNLRNAVSGPLRITHMIGDVAQEGFKVNATEGWRSLLYFVSIISISLFIMNLLPIPVLDGGLILLSLIEMIARREIPAKITYRVQFIGFVFIAVLFVLALVADVSFLIS